MTSVRRFPSNDADVANRRAVSALRWPSPSPRPLEEHEEKEEEEEEEKGERKSLTPLECLSESPRMSLGNFLEAS